MQVWQRSNWKWYCKAEHWYDGSAAVVAQWDPAHSMRLAVTTAEGLHRQVRGPLAFPIAVMDCCHMLMPAGRVDQTALLHSTTFYQRSTYLVSFHPFTKLDTATLSRLCLSQEGLQNLLPNGCTLLLPCQAGCNMLQSKSVLRDLHA